MSELNDSWLDLGRAVIEYSICVSDTNCVICDWTSGFALHILLRQKDAEGKIRQVQMGKKLKCVCCVLHVPVVYFDAGCQIQGTVCILLFPPVQVASHGEPH